MPASEAILSAFCANWAGQIAASTVSTWLAGLHFWHKFHGSAAKYWPQCPKVWPKWSQTHPSALSAPL
jgi:hypothetical protein